MNWLFGANQTRNDDCAAIEPLLPLYADGMASPGEARRVEAHLPDCGGCRETLAWMQATHRALAGRPIALPPADLQVRIAQAIAASSAAPISLRPARLFTLRPAYAAAASLTALGIALSYPLWHSPTPVVAPHPVSMPVAATVPAVKVHTLSLPPQSHMKPNHSLVATRMPRTIESVTVRKAPATFPMTVEPKQIARNSPVPAAHSEINFVKPFVKALAPISTVPKLTARKLTTPTVKHAVVLPEKTAPKMSETPLVASRVPEPAHVPVQVLPPIVTSQPPVRTASAPTPSVQYADILGSVKLKIEAINNEAPAATRYAARASYRGAANIGEALNNEHFGYLDAVHGK